jgi:hypothetical protein
VCPPRSRSSATSLRWRYGRRSGTPADTPQLGRCHAPYQVTPAVLGRRRATQRKPVRPTVRQWQRVSPPPPENPNHQPDVTDQIDSLPLSGRALARRRRSARSRCRHRHRWSSDSSGTDAIVLRVAVFARSGMPAAISRCTRRTEVGQTHVSVPSLCLARNGQRSLSARARRGCTETAAGAAILVAHPCPPGGPENAVA